MSISRRLLLPALAIGLVLSACGGPAEDPAQAGPNEPVAEEPSESGEGEQVPEDDQPSPEPAPVEESPSEDAAEEPADDAAGLSQVTVYFVRTQDAGNWVEPELHELNAPTEAVAGAAMELLFAGEPHDDALVSIAPAGVRVLATNIVDRVLIVDVSDDILSDGTGSAGEAAFAEQLAHTAAAFATVDTVQLWVEGEPIEELWGHLDWSQPIEPDPFALSPITIAQPSAAADQAQASVGDVTLRGEATVFEATFLIRLYDGDAMLIEETFVTASEGGPGRGDWEHTFAISEPGSYVVEVEEDDPSDGEGRPPFISTRSFEVG